MEVDRQKVNWRSRIVKRGTILASQITKHPNNPRRHPQFQRDVVAGSFDELGQIAPIVLNINNGYLVDGEERSWLALAQDGDVEVEAVWVDLTEEEHLKALAYLDASGALAEYDGAVLDEIYGEIETEDEALHELLRNLKAEAKPLSKDDNESNPQGNNYEIFDPVFPSDNEWEIPLLDITKQAHSIDIPICIWGTVGRTKRMNGTWIFYTDDSRFTHLWDDPTTILQTQCVNIVEPNFSTFEQMPLAICLWQVYRKRFLARFWQSYGVTIFVDLNVAPKCYTLNLLGVPKGWRAWCTRGYTERLDYTEQEYQLACEHAGTKDILFWVYGGGKQVQGWCQQRGIVWVQEIMDSRKDKDNG